MLSCTIIGIISTFNALETLQSFLIATFTFKCDRKNERKVLVERDIEGATWTVLTYVSDYIFLSERVEWSLHPTPHLSN